MGVCESLVILGGREILWFFSAAGGRTEPPVLMQSKEGRVLFQLGDSGGLGCHLLTRSSPGQQGLEVAEVSEPLGQAEESLWLPHSSSLIQRLRC